VLSGGVLGAPQIVPTNGSGSGGGFFGSPRLKSSAAQGGRLFVLNAQSSDVSVFTIGAGGSLTAVSSLPFPIGGFSSGAIAVDPAGAFLYAGTQSQGIAKLAIDPTTGALEAVPGSPFAGATGGRQVDGLEVHPSGGYLLASLPDAEQLTVVSTTSMSPAPFSPRFGDGVPTGVLFDATGSRAFAADIFSGTTVSVYDFGVFAPLTLSNLTVKANGTFNPKTGFATITGSFNRSTTTAASVQVSLFQKVGRTTIINGSSFAVLPCGSGASPWTVQITGAAFGGGAAFATVSVSAIDPVTGQFLQTQVENVPVKLKGS
jgi:DNA-binding beta-propeller fold protein YncE